MRVVAVAVCLTGCFSKPPPPSGRVDGGIGSDGSIAIDAPDMTPLCITWGEFSTTLQLVTLPTDVAEVIEPTLSNDGTDLMFTSGNVPYESVRADTVTDFDSDASVAGLGAVTPAWLSPNRLTLYGVDAGANFVKRMRPTPTSAFSGAAESPFADTQDATLVTNETQVIYATTGGVIYLVDDSESPPVKTSLVTETSPLRAFSPSIGDHDRTLVWSRVDPATPKISQLWQGQFTSGGVQGRHSLGLGAGFFYSGPIVSYDGSTLYVTATSNLGTIPAKLYKTQRPCMD